MLGCDTWPCVPTFGSELISVIPLKCRFWTDYTPMSGPRPQGKGIWSTFGEQHERWPQPKNLGAATWDFSWETSLTWCYLHKLFTMGAFQRGPKSSPYLQLSDLCLHSWCLWNALLSFQLFIGIFLQDQKAWASDTRWCRLVSGIEELNFVFV